MYIAHFNITKDTKAVPSMVNNISNIMITLKHNIATCIMKLNSSIAGPFHVLVDFEVRYQEFELISLLGLQQILQLH